MAVLNYGSSVPCFVCYVIIVIGLLATDCPVTTMLKVLNHANHVMLIT